MNTFHLFSIGVGLVCSAADLVNVGVLVVREERSDQEGGCQESGPDECVESHGEWSVGWEYQISHQFNILVVKTFLDFSGPSRETMRLASAVQKAPRARIWRSLAVTRTAKLEVKGRRIIMACKWATVSSSLSPRAPVSPPPSHISSLTGTPVWPSPSSGTPWRWSWSPDCPPCSRRIQMTRRGWWCQCPPRCSWRGMAGLAPPPWWRGHARTVWARRRGSRREASGNCPGPDPAPSSAQLRLIRQCCGVRPAFASRHKYLHHWGKTGLVTTNFSHKHSTHCLSLSLSLVLNLTLTAHRLSVRIDTIWA